MREYPPTNSTAEPAATRTRSQVDNLARVPQSQRSTPHRLRGARQGALWAAVLAAVCLAASVLPALPAQQAGAQATTDIIFEGGGWGHGVGMSQNGARNMAAQGRDHVSILNHYYPNTILSEIPALDVIRVHIGDAPSVGMSSSAPIVFERNGSPIVGSPSGSITVSSHDGGLQIGDVWTTADQHDPVTVSFTKPIKLQNNGHSYLWGKFQLSSHKGKVRVVEALALEDYVKGISEMPAAWPLEALMAQAIAARTYAHEVTLHRRSSPEWAQAYDISATTVDQNYIGWDAQDGTWDAKWVAAAVATAGVEIIDSNGPVRAYYSASNGGWTESAAYVFGNNVPYTVAGPDPFDEGGHPWTTWTRQYSTQSLTRWLNANERTAVGQVQSISVLGGAGASARLDKATVEIVGSNGTRRVSGKQLMLAINAGVFGEGGGLSTHLPGTLMTIGNGASAGAPQPSGQSPIAAPTPDPVPADASGGYVPPEGWVPVPGTGVSPSAAAPSAAAPSAPAPATDNQAAPADPEPSSPAPTAEPSVVTSDNTYTPPPGWTPEPGTGIAPIAAAKEEVLGTGGGSGDLDNILAAAAAWEPVPGTGVPPGTDAAMYEILRAAAAWQPTPGTAIPPGTDPAMVEILRAAAAWQPTPGTGFAPGTDEAMQTILRAAAEWEPTPGTGIPPGTDPAMVEILRAAAAWQPTPGTGFAPGTDEAMQSILRAAAEWKPVPGTGVPPGTPVSAVPVGGGQSFARSVTASSAAGVRSDATFGVVASDSAFAEQARERLRQMSIDSQVGAAAGVDLTDVDGVCTMQHGQVTCLPIASYFFIVDSE